MGIRVIAFLVIVVLLLSVGVSAVSDFDDCAADLLYDATTFAICEYVDEEDIVDETTDAGIDVVQDELAHRTLRQSGSMSQMCLTYYTEG